MIEKTPKGLRLHIGIFGRTNVGKSSFLNLIAGQEAAITSPMPGTTTDVVEKTMELLPIGPVMFLDTAGLDDDSEIGGLRVARTKKVFDRSDVMVLVLEAGVWTEYEQEVVDEAKKRGVPVFAVINKTDIHEPSGEYLSKLKNLNLSVMCARSHDPRHREAAVSLFKKELIKVCPEDFLNPTALAGDLVPSGGLAILIVPIDLEAPKGRIILPQVQVLRDLLDHDAAVMVVKESEYASTLKRLNKFPDLVVCDSQVVDKMVVETPSEVLCTTFSILFTRFKGDLNEMVRGSSAVETLKSGDRVLIAEACTHHAVEDDIGRVKIPRWLKNYTGLDLDIQVHAGCNFPADLRGFKLVIHCGSCMPNRRTMLSRIQAAQDAGVPITNYGVCISYLHRVLDRALSPFPAALEIYKNQTKQTGDRSRSQNKRPVPV